MKKREAIKQKANAFRHYVRDERRQRIHEKFGNNGYAVLFKTYELLINQPGIYLEVPSDLSQVVELLNLDGSLNNSDILEIWEDMSILGLIDRELWTEYRVLFSPNLETINIG